MKLNLTDQHVVYRKIRKGWGSISPVEKIKPSKKIYNRKKVKVQVNKVTQELLNNIYSKNNEAVL